MDARVSEQSTRCQIATYQSDHSLRVHGGTILKCDLATQRQDAAHSDLLTSLRPWIIEPRFPSCGLLEQRPWLLFVPVLVFSNFSTDLFSND